MLVLALLRAGRALLGWTGEDLAAAAGLSWATVRNYERGGSPPTPKSIRRMAEALAKAGVEILLDEATPGVRFRPGFAPTSASKGLMASLATAPAEGVAGPAAGGDDQVPIT